MRLLAELRERARAIVFRAREDREAEEELRYHLELESEANLRKGMSPAEARRRARLALGGAVQVREAVADARGMRWLEELAQDARYAVRTLGRSRRFTLVVVAMLALGIGANSALFGVLDAVLNRVPPGVPASDRLVWLTKPGPFEDASYPDYLDLREAAEGVVDVAAYVEANVALGSGGEPERVPSQLVSDNYFRVLGVDPVRGRTFVPADDRGPGASAVVVVGHDLWQRRFGGDPGIVGAGVVINGREFTVVGVAPAGFVGNYMLSPAELWVPIAMQPVAKPLRYDLLADRRFPQFHLLGRLAAGVSIERAQAAVSAITARVDRVAPDRFSPFRLELEPLRGWVTPRTLRTMRPQIAFAWALTVLVLLVVCANVANLLLARAVRRQREIGIRLAIGAARWRLVRQLLTESLVLALMASGAGMLVAFWAASWFKAALLRGSIAPVDVTPRVSTIAFTVVMAFGTAVLFGLAPALRGARPEAARSLIGEGVGLFRRGRLQAALVTAQVAISVALLFTGGVFLRKLQAMYAVEHGYHADDVVAASFDLYAQRYDDDAIAAFYDELRARLATLPDVVAASVPAYAPLGGGAVFYSVRLAPRDDAYEPPAGALAAAGVGVGPDYFRTLGIPLVRGRDFEPTDYVRGARAVIVSESLARRVWPGRDAIGQSFRLESGEYARELVVVGIARDIAAPGILNADRALVYVPYTRHSPFNHITLLIRTAGDRGVAVRALRDEIRQMDATLPLFDVQTLADIVDRRLGETQRLAGLVSSFGVLALLLAALGLYGVIAYTVAGRTREIGLRIALGARDRRVVGLFVRDGLRLTAVGVASGALLSIALGRVLASVVDDVKPLDLPAALGVIATLILATTIATYLPARRAARIDPMRALRAE